ncbi:hypothetical protein BT96DRAFT_844829, partial [Gymnopus androsaceus JB14]
YYSLIDNSIMWKTAMHKSIYTQVLLMHCTWFHKAEWEARWIDTAVQEKGVAEALQAHCCCPHSLPPCW